MNREEFYALRDNRSDMCVDTQGYQKAACVVQASMPLRTFADQTTLLVACNLLSRWCRTVFLDLQDAPCHPALGNSARGIVEHTLSEMRAADPFGVFAPGPPKVKDAIRLYVGGAPQDGGFAICINGCGWLAAVGRQMPLPSANGDLNPFGPIAAACLGVAEIFRRAVDACSTHRPVLFDAFSWTCLPSSGGAYRPFTPPCIGNALMVGAGAVGSSSVYCLRAARAKGRLTCVDHDVTKIENLNRSPVFEVADCGKSKVVGIQKFVAGSEIIVNPVESDWNQFASGRPRKEWGYDYWLPLANERNVRWQIANAFPPLLIHASTGTSWAVNFGRHIPMRGECLADRFPQQVDKAVFQCSTGEVKTTTGIVDAALPFLSCFAGLLVATDIARLSIAGYPHVPNFAQFGFRNGLHADAFDREARQGCICTTLPRGIWADLAKNSPVAGWPADFI